MVFKKIRQQFRRIRLWFLGITPVKRFLSEAEETDWCLVGNIVGEHAVGVTKDIRRGTKHFRPGTKVFCLPTQWGDGYERVIAVGICRRSNRWISIIMPTELITNWRAKKVYNPTVLRKLREGYKNFHRQWKSKIEVDCWVESLRKDERSDENPICHK